MVHIWMMHKKLISEGDDGHVVQECLFDELWEDTSNRIRGAGINELSVRKMFDILACAKHDILTFLSMLSHQFFLAAQVNKYLKEVQGYSFRVCLELDHVLSLSKKTVTPKLLRGNDASSPFQNNLHFPSRSQHRSNSSFFSLQNNSETQ